MALCSDPCEASPKIGVLLTGGHKSLGGRGLQTPPNSLKSIGQALGLDVRVVDGRLHISRLHARPVDDRPLWAQRLSSKSSFCRAVVQSGLLTRRQMVHAAWRYRLGRSKDDAVIYWQIDQLGQLHDGKLMWYGADCHRLKHRHATWAMYLLKQHYGVPQDTFQSSHCFFGQHLLSHTDLTDHTDYSCSAETTEKTSVESVRSACPKNSLSVISAVSACPKKILSVESVRSVCPNNSLSVISAVSACPQKILSVESVRSVCPNNSLSVISAVSVCPKKRLSVGSVRSVCPNNSLSVISAVSACPKKILSVESVRSACPKTVCVVEAEKSAVILSELYPQCIWLAAGGMFELQVQKFLLLRHHKIILFPDTDPDGRAFQVWYDVAQQVMRSFFWPPSNLIRVSPLLELHATPDQKRRKIDLVDYLFEQ